MLCVAATHLEETVSGKHSKYKFTASALPVSAPPCTAEGSRRWCFCCVCLFLLSKWILNHTPPSSHLCFLSSVFVNCLLIFGVPAYYRTFTQGVWNLSVAFTALLNFNLPIKHLFKCLNDTFSGNPWHVYLLNYTPLPLICLCAPV